MRARLLLVALLTAPPLLLSDVPPARACSCAAGPPPPVVFEGVSEGRRGEGWAFAVERVERGTVGRRAVVDLDVDNPEDNVYSSCSLGPPPVEGRRYRVTATISNRGGRQRLVSTLCGGGSLTPLSGVGAVRRQPEEEPRSAPDGPLLGAVALTLVGAIFLLGRRDSPSPPA